MTVRRVNSPQITLLSATAPPTPSSNHLKQYLSLSSPSPVSKHDTTRERWSVRAISGAKFSGAAAAAVLFHTLIPWRMCNYALVSGWCAFSCDRRKSLMNTSMRYCLRVRRIGAREEKPRRAWPWPAIYWNKATLTPDGNRETYRQ